MSIKYRTYIVIPAVVWIELAGHVDLRTAKEDEDGNSDDEPTRGDDDESDGADRRQLKPRHDEPAAETAECTGQRPRQSCANRRINYLLFIRHHC